MSEFTQYHEVAIIGACIGVLGAYIILIYKSCCKKKRQNEQSQLNPMAMNTTTNPNMMNNTNTNLWEWFLRHEIQCSENTVNQFRLQGYGQNLHLWPHFSHDQLKNLGFTDHQRHVWFSKDMTKIVHTLKSTSGNPMFHQTQNPTYTNLFQNTNPNLSMGIQSQVSPNGNTDLGINSQQTLIPNSSVIPVQATENETVSIFQPQHSILSSNSPPMDLRKEPPLIMESWACMLRHELRCPEQVIQNFHRAGLVSEGHWLHCTAEELALLALGFDYSTMLQWKMRFPPKKENIDQDPVILQQQHELRRLKTDVLSLKEDLDQCQQKLAQTIQEHKEHKKKTKKKEKKKHQNVTFTDPYQKQQYPQAPYYHHPEQYSQNGLDMTQLPQFSMYPPLYNPRLEANSESDEETSSASESNYYVEQEIESSSLFM